MPWRGWEALTETIIPVYNHQCHLLGAGEVDMLLPQMADLFLFMKLRKLKHLKKGCFCITEDLLNFFFFTSWGQTLNTWKKSIVRETQFSFPKNQSNNNKKVEYANSERTHFLKTTVMERCLNIIFKISRNWEWEVKYRR